MFHYWICVFVSVASTFHNLSIKITTRCLFAWFVQVWLCKNTKYFKLSLWILLNISKKKKKVKGSSYIGEHLCWFDILINQQVFIISCTSNINRFVCELDKVHTLILEIISLWNHCVIHSLIYTHTHTSHRHTHPTTFLKKVLRKSKSLQKIQYNSNTVNILYNFK